AYAAETAKAGVNLADADAPSRGKDGMRVELGGRLDPVGIERPERPARDHPSDCRPCRRDSSTRPGGPMSDRDMHGRHARVEPLIGISSCCAAGRWAIRM